MDWLRSAFSSQRSLGPLEQELLRILWQRGDATVREIVDEVKLDAAYTTIMTTLDRLYKKGVLLRANEGRAFRYRPRHNEEEFNRTNVAAGLDQWFAAAEHAGAPISFLVDEISKRDTALLDELQQAIEAKRRELKRKEPK
jgi:predicted transcriptional regulator